MDYALMFNVLEGGVSEPITWGKENLQPDKNIIILDEESSSLFLWYGAKQGLVARRTALRQAESLKGHGYIIGKSIVGRDIKELKEIDERKIGRDPETDKLNEQLQDIINREYKELENYIVTFDTKGISTPAPKPVKTPDPTPMLTSPPKPVSPVQTKPKMAVASEYDMKPVITKTVIHEPKPEQLAPKTPTVTPKVTEGHPKELSIQAKIGFVFMSILDFFDDIWVSKKEDGTYSVEHMDGKVCEFSVEEGKIKFSTSSFSGISTNIKTEIQRKFLELSKLI